LLTNSTSSTSVNGGAAQSANKKFLLDSMNHTGYAQVFECN